MRARIAAVAFAFAGGLVASAARADVRSEARSHFRLGMSLLGEGRVDEGVAELELAYEILPHPGVLYVIARAYAESARYDDAIRSFERYLASDPPDRREIVVFVGAMREALAARERRDAERDARAIAIASVLATTPSEPLRRGAAPLQELAIAAPVEVPDDALRAAPIDLYEPSIVTAARSRRSLLDAPASAAIVSRQDVRLSGLTSIPEILRRVAGVEVATLSPVDASVAIRGFGQRATSRTLVLVDGRSTYVDALGTTLWGLLPLGPADVERIEIVRGPMSATYGAQAWGGVVNIVTRPAGVPITTATIGAGNGGAIVGHAQTAGRIEHLAYRIAAGYQRANRFSLEIAPQRVDHARPEGDPALAIDTAFASARLRYRIARDIDVSLDGGFARGRQDLAGAHVLRDALILGSTGHVLGSIDTRYGSVRASYAHLDGSIAGTVPRGFDPRAFDLVSGALDVEARFTQEFELFVHHDLHVGAAYRRRTLTSSAIPRPVEQNHYALFVEDSIRAAEWLSLVGSFRADFHPLLSDPVFSPRGAVVVHPTPRRTIRASVGTGFRAPTLLESYLDLAVPTSDPAEHVQARGSLGLVPESRLSVELGYRDESSELFDVEVNGFYDRVGDLVSLTTLARDRLADLAPAPIASYPVGTITFASSGTTFDVIGGEAMTSVHPIAGLDVHASYALVATFASASTTTHRVNAGVQYRSDFGLDLSIDAHFVSDQRFVEPALATPALDLPAYYLVNARVGYRLFDDRLDLAIVGFNITDHRHRQHPFGQELSARVLFTVAYRM